MVSTAIAFIVTLSDRVETLMAALARLSRCATMLNACEMMISV
jgi:hypothetical protein